jgi:predicted TIM-barrel fold metal-dependent hydrolase
MAGYNARTFAEAPDKTLSLMMLQAYNDWHVDEWCTGAPGRFIPIGMLPMWDPNLAASEIRRLAQKGCKAVSFLEAPHAQGYPSLLSGHWDPILDAVVDVGTVLCLHIGGAQALIQLPEEAPVDHSIVLPTQLTMLVAQDLLFGPTFRKYPTLKVAFSEAGIGWIPFYLDRVDRHVRNQKWLQNDFGGRLPSEIFRDHVLACFISDPSGLKARDRIGIENIAWECDYPHTDTTWPESPEQLWTEVGDAGATDEEIDKISWQNACRFFDWDPFVEIPQHDATVGTLRARATHVDTARVSKNVWRRRNEAAGIGVIAS